MNIKKIILGVAILAAAGLLAMLLKGGFTDKGLENVSLTEEGSRFTIAVSYPVFSGLPESVGVNTAIKTLVDDSIAEFKKQVIETDQFIGQEEDASPALTAGKSSLHMSYKSVLTNDKIVSGYFIVSNYAARAAHPNNYTIVFNYNLLTRTMIARSEIISDANLGALAEVVRPLLLGQIYERVNKDIAYEEGTLIGSGLDPKEENWSRFTITKDGPQFHFDPYQVGPYALGGFIVLVPWDQLEGIASYSFRE